MQDYDTISELMDRYGTTILHLAYSYVRNRQTAEDLTQEIFIKCYENLSTFKGEAAIQTWLYRIAINHCKDYVKSWHYRKVYTSEFISALLKVQQNGAEKEYIKKADRNELYDHILSLPIKYKEVIVLAYFHELTMGEISVVCGVNVNTIKSRISRAKKLLKETIIEGSEEYGRYFDERERPDTKGRIS